MAKTRKMKFKTEVNKLLDILTHSLYSNREIFLRELISNSSDALDKLRFESTRGTDLVNPDLALEISIDADEKAKQITITDTGIGMNEEDIITNLGTIAKSGTEAFLNMMAENGKAEEKDKDDASAIIGKFGVGFYSVFMAADKVVVTSKSFKKDEPAVRWTSDGLGSFSLDILEEEVKRGTSIEIHLREDANDFAGKDKIKEVIERAFPTVLNVSFIDSL